MTDCATRTVERPDLTLPSVPQLRDGSLDHEPATPGAREVADPSAVTPT